MPFNGSGIYNLPVTTVTPAVSGTTIDDSEFNTFTADLKSALTNCIVKDGQTVSPTLTTPAIVSPTISGSPVFTSDILLERANPSLNVRCLDEATQNTIVALSDEFTVARALIYRPAGLDLLRLEARDALGVPQAVLLITEAGNIEVNSGTFKATSAELTSPVINTGVSGTAGVSRMVRETAIATTSGTSKSWSSLPSWIKKIDVIFDYVSQSTASAQIYIQIGTGGVATTTGYISNDIIAYDTGDIITNVSATSYYVVAFTNNTSRLSGAITLYNITGNTWIASGSLVDQIDDESHTIAGRIDIAGTLDFVNIGTNGTAFDNGQANIVYEG